MKAENYMTLEFPSKSCNEAFARSAVACFAAQMDPTMEELGDRSGRFNYELPCDLGIRIPRDYYKNGTCIDEMNYFA